MTQKKRKFSEHILSIGSKEQNLDIPKLESSQAPEANEPTATCGAVAQDESGTSTTAAQGLKNRGKRMIHVSSRQSGVLGVSWTWRSKLGSWQVFWFEEKNMKKKYFHVRHFMKTSKAFCEAEADALRAAIEFRKGLERSGIAKAKRVEKPHSGVKGVLWCTRDKAWEVKSRLSTVADDWNDAEVGEESEMDSQHGFQECRTSPTKPRWLDEQTEIPREEYNSYD